MNRSLSDVDLLRRLVGFDSTSSNSNLPIADFICDYLDLPGVRIARNYNADGSKVNLIIRCGRDVGGSDTPDERSGLILSGHMDVVPANEPEWSADPFSLTETQDAYVGRGACDMKGFVALAVNALRRAADDPPVHPLVLVLTFDEEPGTLGAQHLAETWDGVFPLPRWAIIGEPTSLRVVRMHKGHTKMRVVVRGRAAHSGYPHLGLCAVEPMGRIITALADLRRRWKDLRVETSAFFPDVPFVALNLGVVRGGSAVNVVPERSELEFGFRPLPGMDARALIRQVQEVVLRDPDADRVSIELLGDSPPLLTPESSQVYQTLCMMIGQTDTIGVSYASDAGPLATMDIECVLWGPGAIEVAHKPNESIPKGEFGRAGELLEQAVGRFCR